MQNREKTKSLLLITFDFGFFRLCVAREPETCFEFFNGRKKKKENNNCIHSRQSTKGIYVFLTHLLFRFLRLFQIYVLYYFQMRK